MFSQNRSNFDYAVTRRGGTNDQSYISRRLADGGITRSVVDQARVSRALADRREADTYVARTTEGARRFGDVTALVPPRRNPPPGLPAPGRQVGEALGPLSGILGSAAGGAAALGEAAVIGGVAAAPVLAAGAAVAGVGYGVYKLGESFHLW